MIEDKLKKLESDFKEFKGDKHIFSEIWKVYTSERIPWETSVLERIGKLEIDRDAYKRHLVSYHKEDSPKDSISAENCPMCIENKWNRCDHRREHFIKEIARLKEIIKEALEYIKEFVDFEAQAHENHLIELLEKYKEE